jgi:hypothetical protein
MTYIDTSKQVGDPEHVKALASADAARARFDQHDPEGVAFEYPVLEAGALAGRRSNVAAFIEPYCGRTSAPVGSFSAASTRPRMRC